MDMQITALHYKITTILHFHSFLVKHIKLSTAFPSTRTLSPRFTRNLYLEFQIFKYFLNYPCGGPSMSKVCAMLQQYPGVISHQTSSTNPVHTFVAFHPWILLALVTIGFDCWISVVCVSTGTIDLLISTLSIFFFQDSHSSHVLANNCLYKRCWTKHPDFFW